MTGPLGLTGATGNIGGRVARLLAADGVSTRRELLGGAAG